MLAEPVRVRLGTREERLAKAARVTRGCALQSDNFRGIPGGVCRHGVVAELECQITRPEQLHKPRIHRPSGLAFHPRAELGASCLGQMELNGGPDAAIA